MFSFKYLVLLLLSLPLLLSISSCANRVIAWQMVSAPNQSLLGTTVNNQFELINTATDKLIALNGFKRKQLQLPKNDIVISYFDIPAGDYCYVFRTTPVRYDHGCIDFIQTIGIGMTENALPLKIPFLKKGTY